MEWRPKRLTSALGLLLGALVLSGGLLSALGHESALSHAQRFLRAEQGVDSWGPMVVARDYLASPQSDEQPLYDWLFFEHSVKFIYPPSSLLAIEALDAAAPRSAWAGLLNALSWLLVIATALACVAVLEGAVDGQRDPLPERIARAAVGVGLAITFYPIAKAYSLGQAQVLANAALAALVLAWQRGWPRTAGVLVAVMAAVKPQYALLAVWGLLRRRWDFSAAAALAGGALLAVSLAFYGFAHHWNYVEVLEHLSRVGEAFHPNQSINGLLNRLLQTGDAVHWHPTVYPVAHPLVRWGTLLSSLALLCITLFWPSRASQRGGVIDLCAMALAATLASPIAWEHHFGVLLPIFAVLAPIALARGRGAALGLAVAFVVAASYVEGVTRSVGPVAGLLQSSLLFAALAVWGALIWLRAAPALRAHTP